LSSDFRAIKESLALSDQYLISVSRPFALTETQVQAEVKAEYIDKIQGAVDRATPPEARNKIRVITKPLLGYCDCRKRKRPVPSRETRPFKNDKTALTLVTSTLFFANIFRNHIHAL